MRRVKKRIIKDEINAMKLKICGLKTLHDVDCVNRAGVDYAGFVFADSRQKIEPETARTLRRELRADIKAVGVFVDEPYEFIRDLAESGVIDVVQVHGAREYGMPCPTIKAFRVTSAADIKPTECDFVLFDSYKKGTRGSTGGVFDWRLIDGYVEKPFFIAGGINRDNIRAAMALEPYCVDISSGAEENGSKSYEKIARLAEEVRNANFEREM
jgi:phosphoribosylanthranilate isomerase